MDDLSTSRNSVGSAVNSVRSNKESEGWAFEKPSFLVGLDEWCIQAQHAHVATTAAITTRGKTQIHVDSIVTWFDHFFPEPHGSNFHFRWNPRTPLPIFSAAFELWRRAAAAMR